MKVDFALSKSPHLHRAYLLTVFNQKLIAVIPYMYLLTCLLNATYSTNSKIHFEGYGLAIANIIIKRGGRVLLADIKTEVNLETIAEPFSHLKDGVGVTKIRL